jgi:hypothetical protein
MAAGQYLHILNTSESLYYFNSTYGRRQPTIGATEMARDNQSFTNEMPLSDLAIPELEVVLMERCGILAPDFFTPPTGWPSTMGELVNRSHLEKTALIDRLKSSAEACTDIGFVGDLSAIAEFSDQPGHLLLACDMNSDLAISQMLPRAISTACRDWTGIYAAILAADNILCICHDGKRSFSTALAIRERYDKKARYVKNGFGALTSLLENDRLGRVVHSIDQ